MTELHCFYTDEHIVVAKSLEDACENWDEWTNTHYEDYDDDDAWEDAHFIVQIPDEKTFAVFVEDELKTKPEGVEIEGAVWKATSRAWAESQGRGYLCGSEY